MKLLLPSVMIMLVLTACGGGKGDTDDSLSANKPSSGAQGSAAATSSECQGGVTATGTLCAAKQPVATGAAPETM